MQLWLESHSKCKINNHICFIALTLAGPWGDIGTLSLIFPVCMYFKVQFMPDTVPKCKSVQSIDLFFRPQFLNRDQKRSISRKSCTRLMGRLSYQTRSCLGNRTPNKIKENGSSSLKRKRQRYEQH